MTIPPISDLDRFVDKDTAAALLGIGPTYVQQLLKRGDLVGKRVNPRKGRGIHRRLGIWAEVDVLSCIMFAACSHMHHRHSHGKKVATPEQILERLALPPRCECGMLVDAPGDVCELCQAARAGLRYDWKRR